MNERFLIRPFRKSIDMDGFKSLIENYWNENHIFLKSDELLLWQYEGYGPSKGMHFPVLFDGDKLVGFRCCIPAELRVPMQKHICIEPVAVGSMWLVLPEYRGQKLGLALQQYTLEQNKNFLVIASNLKTSAPMHRRSGYAIKNQMLRYVLPLNENYGNLLVEHKGGFVLNISNTLCEEESPVCLSAFELETFWLSSIGNQSILSLNKTKEFWQWRFLDSPVYQYLFFGGKGKGGVVVGRVCTLYEDGKPRQETVFRILELIPEKNEVWNGQVDKALVKLLNGVFRWAQQNGCAGVEFYATTYRLSPVLDMVGMKEVNDSNVYKYLDIVSYYEPVSAAPRLSNVSLCVPDYEGALDFEDVYITLSDADQDRPNILV